MQFSSANVHSGDAISYANLPAGTTVSGDKYAYTFRNGARLTAEQWQTWQRANTSWRVFDQSAQAYSCVDERATSNFVYFNSSNGHYYELMSLSYAAYLDTARNLAHLRNFLGLEGYLATSASAAENNAIVRLMKQDPMRTLRRMRVWHREVLRGVQTKRGREPRWFAPLLCRVFS